LGACGEVNDPSQEPQESKAQDIGYNEGDLVTVKVAVPKQTSNRSVSDDNVEFYANLYEVVFKSQAGTYYRGEGTADQGYVNVPVPIGEKYEVLLLAGYNRTLLAAGWLGVTDAVPGVSAVPAEVGEGTDDDPEFPAIPEIPAIPEVDKRVDIKSGQANVVSIPVTKFPLQWDHGDLDPVTNGTQNNIIADTNDFAFSLNSSTYTGATKVQVKDRYIILAPEEDSSIPSYGPSEIADADTFTVTFNIAKLAPLINADIATTNTTSVRKLTIADYNVQLWARYVNDEFPSVVLKSGTTPNVVYEADAPVSFTNTPGTHKLPKRNVDGVLQFELTYYAFGTDQSKGTAWIIRNGLNRTKDDTTADKANGNTTGTGPGSYFVVKIGSGTPIEDESVTINLP
jgi:hypothetical protein